RINITREIIIHIGLIINNFALIVDVTQILGRIHLTLGFFLSELKSGFDFSTVHNLIGIIQINASIVSSSQSCFIIKMRCVDLWETIVVITNIIVVCGRINGIQNDMMVLFSKILFEIQAVILIVISPVVYIQIFIKNSV